MPRFGIIAGGLRGFESFDSDLLGEDWTPAALRRALEEAGLALVDIFPLCDFEGLPADFRLAMLDRASRYLDFATEIGSPMVMVGSGGWPRRVGHRWKDAQAPLRPGGRALAGRRVAIGQAAVAERALLETLVLDRLLVDRLERNEPDRVAAKCRYQSHSHAAGQDSSVSALPLVTGDTAEHGERGSAHMGELVTYWRSSMIASRAITLCICMQRS